MKIEKNKWLVLLAGICIQIVLGGIYAWSTFVPYLNQDYQLTKGQSGFIFGLTIIFFTAVMIFSGRFLIRKGPKITASISAVLFFAGYVGASFSGGSFILLLVSIGIITGSGIGFGYVCPLATGMKFFPKQKGLVTGVAVAGFGGGAVLLSGTANYFLQQGVDVLLFFRYYGLCAGLILLAAALMLDFPDSNEDHETTQKKASFLNPVFYLSALGLFAGTFAGLLIIGNLSPIVHNAGLTQNQIVASISLFSFGNAAGRLSWGALFDRLNYRTIPLSLLLLALFCILLLVPLPPVGMYSVVFMIGAGFGANFVVYAGAISDYFGFTVFSKLYPVCFMAYGFAGLVAPGSGGYVADRTGSYSSAIIIAVVLLFLVSLFLYFSFSVRKVQEG